MRKLVSLPVLAIVLLMASCGSNNKYEVTGTIESSYDGDKVYLMENVGRELIPVDSTVIANGKFAFKGTQDAPEMHFLQWSDGENQPTRVEFFLEKGKININVANDQMATTVGGTPLNDAFQTFKKEITDVNLKMRDIYGSLNDPSLTEEQKAEKMNEFEATQNEMMDIIKNTVSNNIQTPLATMLLPQIIDTMEPEEADGYLSRLSDEQLQDEDIKKVVEGMENKKKTAEGQKFTDFEMLTPEGNPIKLSDYAGKGKIVLVDFWASWCGPCRREMPRLVDMYAKYKDKGFEIVGVSLDRDGEAWKKGIEELNITWPQMSDLKYWQSEGARIYNVRSIPHVMLIDGEGTIISRGLYGEELEAKVAEVMGN